MLGNAQRPWWVIGSAAVALHGAATPVVDVDVLLDEHDATTLLQALALPAEAGLPSDLFRSDLFGCWTAAPLTVELMAGLHLRNEPVTLTTREPVAVDRVTLYVPSRSELAELRRRFGRPKDLARAALL